MEDETGVLAEDTAAESHQQATEQEVDNSSTVETAEEPVDETGVPLKNRQAEAERKARKSRQAETELLGGSKATESPDQNEAIRVVEAIASQQIKKSLEPLLAKQFLLDNPDAVDMIEQINTVRASHPELAGIDKLELAYKIAKADRQDELIRLRVEATQKEAEITLEKSNQASLEGAGKARQPVKNLNEQIAGANSLEELRKLEAMLSR